MMAPEQRGTSRPRPQLTQRFALAVLLVAVVWSAAPLAAGETSVLGKQGELYRVISGSYGELFADEMTDPSHSVLAVEIRRDGATERLLVPTTETRGLDVEPSLFYEQGTSTLFVVWANYVNLARSRINIIAYDGAEWSELVEISGSQFSWKGAPQVVVTRSPFVVDRMGDEEEAISEEHTRTVLHVLWRQEESNRLQAVYSSVVLVDGAVVQSGTPMVLNDLSAARPASEAPTLDWDLVPEPVLGLGPDEQSVVVGFVDAQTWRLETMTISLVAAELDDLARLVAEELEAAGEGVCDSTGTLASSAEAARMHIVRVGLRFQGHVKSFLAQEAASRLLVAGPDLCAEGGVVAVANDARMHIVRVGATALGGLANTSSAARMHIVRVGVQYLPEGSILGHSARIDLVGSHTLPDLPEPISGWMLSPRGTGALLAWEREDAIEYVTLESLKSSEGPTWSEPITLRLDAELSSAEAWSALSSLTASR